MQSLKGKVALITGASSGIGAGIAEYFAKQGAKLSLTGRRQKNLEEVAAKTKLPASDVLTIVGDIVKGEDRVNIIAKTMAKFGKLDILINNAGIVLFDNFQDVPEASYDSIMDTNLKAPIMLTKLAIPHLVKTKGNIVNVSSNASDMMLPVVAVYNLSKVALDAFTKVLAAELGPKGVRVNSVNPGFIPATDILSRGNVPQSPTEVAGTFETASSLRRAGTPEEMAKVTAFLASDLASFVTGEILYADGGLRLRNQ